MTRPRVLFVSVQRAGDVLVHLPAMAALAATGCELHVLLHPAGAPSAPLVRRFAQVHRLPVDFRGGDVAPVAATVDALTAMRFDRVVNLTLKPFAAELAERIAPGRVEGLAMPGGRPRLTSPWLGYVNDWGTAAPLSVLHYGDVYCRALGSSWQRPDVPASEETEAWWREARNRAGLGDAQPFVALQLSTSEPKKTWPVTAWRALVEALAARDAGLGVVVLAGPDEVASVEAFCASTGGRAKPLPCTFEQALRVLSASRLLVSGDTALVHLAAVAGTRTVLLSSGSSAFRELGPHGDGDVVLQAAYPCAPCRHDSGCLLGPQAGYPCTTGVPAAHVAEVVRALVADAPPPSPPAGVTTYVSRRDAHGLLDFQGHGATPASDACLRVLRAHVLASLLRGTESGRTATLRADEVRSVVSMARIVAALIARAEGRERGELNAALAAASDGVVMELANHVGGRLREQGAAGNTELRKELKSLAGRLDGVLRGAVR